MNETVREWLAKAEADDTTADRELTVSEGFNADAVCFHSQQRVEKLLKAILIDRGVVPSRTHDLERLCATVASLEPGCSWSVEELRFLTRAAVAFRHPGESADREDATRALEIASALRSQLRPLLQKEQR
jgi:HEPN domain-containing protein